MILLVQPMVNESEAHYAPLALLCVAAALLDEFDVTILDTRVEKAWHKQLVTLLSSDSPPVLVGISSMTGLQIRYGLDISAIVKELAPSVPVVWGGVHPTNFPEQTLAHPLVDYVVVNSGEQPFLEMARAQLAGDEGAIRKIGGVGFMEADKAVINPNLSSIADLGGIELPWHLVNVGAYADNLSTRKDMRMIDVITSRGCPYRCAFCYVENFYNRKWYGREEQRVIEEIKMLRDKYAITHFLLHDDLVGFGRKGEERLKHIMRAINDGSGPRVYFSANIRVDQLREDYVAELVELGLWQIRAGVESGSDAMLKRMKKDFDTKTIENSALLAKKYGFDINYSFVIGWPNETDEDRRNTVALALKLKRLHRGCTVYPLWTYIPYPGTSFYQDALELGFVPPDDLEGWSAYFWGNAQMPWLDKDAMANMHALSRIAFSNSSRISIVWHSLIDRNIKARVKAKRMIASVLSIWARMRLQHHVNFLPYEHRIIMPLITRFGLN